MGKKSDKSSLITHVLNQGGRKRKLGPIIVDFEHGHVDSGTFEDFKVGVSHKFQEDKGSPELQVVVKTDHLTYSNLAPSARSLPRNESLKTWLVIKNKETNEARLVEANVVTVGGDVTFPKTINPFLLSETRKKKEVEEEASVQEILDEKDARWKHLVKEFGPKRGKRYVEQTERQKLDSSMKNEKLKSVLEDIDASTIVLPEKLAPKELTPPCNREAKSIRDVYNLKDIVSDQEMFLLEQAASELLEIYGTSKKVDEAVQARIFSEVLGDCLKNQHLLLKPDLSIVGFCIYVEAIFAYLNLRPNVVTRGPKVLPSFVPIFVAANIFDKFVPEGIVSQESSDRAFCYGLITLLLISNYSVELKKISSAVKKSQFWLKKLVLVTGASISTDPLTRTSLIELKLPLSNFDLSKVGRKPTRK